MQAYNIPLKIDEIDFDNIVYSDIKSNSKKTVVFLKYKQKNRIVNFAIQTPSLLNINKSFKNSNNISSDLDVPLYGKTESKVNKMVSFFNNLDDKIIYDAKINSSSWFNNFEINQINYQKIIRESTDKRFNKGTIKVKIIDNFDFKTQIQINNQVKINEEDIPKNSWVKMILEIHAIWINKNGFGLFLKPIIISFEPIEIIKKYRFLDDSEDEVENVIDSENSIFIRNDKNNDEFNSETSLLKVNPTDSLTLNNRRFSSTSSDEEITTKKSNENI